MKQKTIKKTSMSAIARELGVSTALVSNVLRNTSSTTQVCGATRRKIVDAAWRSGLRLNNTIGVVLPSEVIENKAIFYPGFAGISERCAQLGLGTLQAVSSEEDDIPEFLKKRDVCGVIFWNNTSQRVLDSALNEKIPFVLMNPSDCVERYDAVLFNDYETMCELFQYLYSKNYRKYIFIPITDGNRFVETSLKAFNDFLDRKNLDGKVIPWSNTADPTFLEKLKRVVRNADPQTAIMTFSRFATIKILELCTLYGKQIPDDLGLVGSNVIADYYSPKLTCVVNPFYEMGAAAVDIIAEKWRSHQFKLNINRFLNGIIMKNMSTRGGSCQNLNIGEF